MANSLVFIVFQGRADIHLERAETHLWKGLHDDGQEELQEEETADYHQKGEIDTCNQPRGVEVLIHDGGPAFEGDHPEYWQDSHTNIIEMKNAVLYETPLIDNVIF